MVSKWVIPPRNTPFIRIGEITHLLNIDPNFLGHPSKKLWLFLVPVKGGIGGIVHPPIGRKNTTYIPLIVLAFWGVICYRSHLLREPETTIEKLVGSSPHHSSRFLKGPILDCFQFFLSDQQYLLQGLVNDWAAKWFGNLRCPPPQCQPPPRK